MHGAVSQANAAFRSIERFIGQRRGNVLILAALAMPVALGGAGLATDTIQWSLMKRQLQQQADAGSESGAYAKAQGANVASAVQSDLATTAKVTLLGTPTIENAPTTGPYAGNTQAVRVVLQSQIRLPFSNLFLAAAPVLTAEATSLIVTTGQYCVIALDSSSTTGISIAGNATLALGCGINSNAKGSSAIVAQGSSTANVTAVSAVGSIPSSSSYVSTAKFFPHSIPQQDPFASLPDPVVSSCSNQLKSSPNQTTNVSPGCFKGFDIKGTVNFAPGVYYIDGSNGGSFDIGAQANLNGSDVTFILTSSTAATNPGSIATANINGGATLNLSASTTGTYTGVLLYQDRRALDTNTNLINGNASSTIQGAVYFPKQVVGFNGTAGLNSQCLQLVGKRVTFSGNSTITNTCPANSGAQSFPRTVVRLVG